MNELQTEIAQLLELDNKELAIVEKKNQLLAQAKLFDQIQSLDLEVARLQDMKSLVNESITTAMRESGHDLFEGTFADKKVRIKYTAPSVRQTVNTDVLKATYPDVYKAVLKETQVKDKVTITIKGVE